MNAAPCGGILRACLAIFCLLLLAPRVMPAAGTPAGTTIDNQATVVYTASDSTMRSVVYGNHLSLRIGQRAVVNVAPAAGARGARLGEIVDYAATVTNSGNGIDSFTLAATSSLGIPVSIYRDINRDGVLDSLERSAGTIAGTGPLAADSAEAVIVRLTVPDNLALNGTSDQLNLTAASRFDPLRSATGTYTTNIMSALVVVTTGVSNPTPQVASRVVHTITCTNTGAARAESLVVTDMLHAKLHYVGGSSSPAVDSVNGQTLVWKIGALAPGAVRVITFTTELDESLLPGMTVHNVAEAAYSDGGTRRTRSSTETGFITVATGSDVTVTIGPDTAIAAEAGDTVACPLLVANTGVAPREFELMAASTRGVQWRFIDDANGNARADVGEPVVTRTGPVTGGERVHVVALGLLPAVAADRTLDSTRFVARSLSDTNNAAACVAIATIGRPVMKLVKSAAAPNPVAGGEITYTIAYTNAGSGRAERFRVVDALPANTTLVPGSIRLNAAAKTEALDADEVTVANATLTIDIGTVAPNASGTIAFTVTID